MAALGQIMETMSSVRVLFALASNYISPEGIRNMGNCAFAYALTKHCEIRGHKGLHSGLDQVPRNRSRTVE